MVVVEARSFDPAIRTIFAHLPIAPLWRAARRAIAEVAGRSVDAIDASLAARSADERTAWLAALAGGSARLLAAGWVLTSLAGGRALDLATAPLALDRLVPAVAALADPVAILIVPMVPTTVVSLAHATSVAAELCELLRPHAVALVAPRPQLDELCAVAGDRAAIALARQGMIEVDVSADRSVVVPPRSRSHAERVLHAALDRDRQTRGRFALSPSLRIPFNGRDARVDLYDAELALAVEIDGWQHVRDPERYQRDREKDLVLQREGILVLRVLEEDVWQRLDHVVDRVARAVSDRRRSRGAGLHQPR